MSVSSVAKLDYKMDYLVVRTQEAVKRIHLSEISVLILESTAISMTAYLIRELSRNHVDIIFCDEKRCPYSVLMPLHGSHDTALKYRKQAAWSGEIKALVWAEIVRAKIMGQTYALPENCLEAKAALREFAFQVHPGDPTNREGHAAKVYFNAMFGKTFSRSGSDSINAALDYGYGILVSAFAREVVANGYCTQLGLFHDNMFNSLNLACDLMEPFRPYIDRCVKELMPEKLERDEKVSIIQTLNERIYIDGREHHMINAIRIYVKSVFDAVEDKDISLLNFPVYEL